MDIKIQAKNQIDKEIKNIGKVCTSKNCGLKDKFPYCSEGCISAVLMIEYVED